jgi:hypothetical protein
VVLSPRVRSATTGAFGLRIRTGRIAHGTSLIYLLIFCNELPAGVFLGSPRWIYCFGEGFWTLARCDGGGEAAGPASESLPRRKPAQSGPRRLESTFSGHRGLRCIGSRNVGIASNVRVVHTSSVNLPGLPPVLPARFAAAGPARVRSRIRARSTPDATARNECIPDLKSVRPRFLAKNLTSRLRPMG